MKVSKILSFRKRVVVIVIGALLGGLSLLYTNNLAFRLKEKEQHDVALWAHAMERLNRDVLGGTIQVEDPLVDDLISSNNNIPFIITNENLEVISSHLIPDKIIDHPDRLRRQIDKFTEENTPRQVRFWWTDQHYHIIFYGKSALLKALFYYPYIQLVVIAVFVMMVFIAFRSSKQDEQNRVWIGLAKETAHQL
ncbi:MAG: sensor histidine kinase, partial [Alistipes sp.]|nr:sensor histidine kinase [Alistipes sp.]